MSVLIQYKNGVAGIKIPLDDSALRIGRNEDNDICIDDALASREHALVERVKSEQNSNQSDYVVRDLGSTNGTFVNHEQITAHLLVEGDMIRIGQAFFKYSENDHPELEETRIIKKTIIPGIFYTIEKEKE
ncbi:MAG: FHA domain-containing protein [Chromatiales bacterium]|nr:FHA domain-containing protein [Chromatiales bacterium]